jgi:hypothetical protein
MRAHTRALLTNDQLDLFYVAGDGSREALLLG